jgi:D-alanyl-D-alanine carboxypeptidase/D-alanyl-D-alanine-endopeptidase (penicillin-binding protein 4)
LSSALKALQQTYKWLAPNGSSLSLYDGSGMSRHNALSAASIIKLLDHVAADSLNFVDYKNSLSIPGVQGTLAYRMKKLPGKMKVWAKTGSLSRVKSLSGYIELSNGRKYAFSILANQYGGDANSFYRFIEDILELVQRNEEDIK